MFELGELAQGSELFKKRFEMFKTRICDSKTRAVYCCDDDQMPPTDNELKCLKDPESYQTVNKVRLA